MDEIFAKEILKRLQNKNNKISTLIDSNDIKTIFHELDVYEAELLAQNEELIEKENQLLEAKEEFEVLFQNAPISYIVLNEKFNIYKYNTLSDYFFKFTNSMKEKISFLTYIKSNYLSTFFSFIDSGEDSIVVVCRVKNEKKELRFKIKKDFYYQNGEKLIMLTLTNVQKEFDQMEQIKKLEKDKRVQNEILLKQSRIAAIGEMISNIAHQWRQPLTVISTHATSLGLLADFGEEVTKEKIEECAKSVNLQVQYLSKTIDDFRHFFKADLTSNEEVNIKETLLKLHKLIESSFKNNFIEIVSSFSDITLILNENQLIQALINIYNNAKDALCKDTINDRLFFIDVKKDEEFAIIELKDSGGGIDEDIIDKIFDPYFTTKHPSIGTGIGLYMTYEIIVKHFHGVLEVKNVEYKYLDNEYRGVLITIKLPLLRS